jgi:hypothetical protein
MSNWIDKYKTLVISSHKPHVIVADVDKLFQYHELQEAFESEEFRILKASSPLEVRLLFELNVRNSNARCLIVAPSQYNPLPDIELVCNFQKIGLADLFPNLDAKAIQGLSFNALSVLSNIRQYETLGHEKTIRFLLENLYSVDFDSLTNSKAKERVLNALISVFLEKNGINQPIRRFLTGYVKPYFPDLVSQDLSKESLIRFIQTEWLKFLSGDSQLNFNEPLISKSLGFLFSFELIKPVKVSPEKYEAIPKALRIGAYIDEKGNNDEDLLALVAYLSDQCEIIEDVADQWFKLVHVLAQAYIRVLNSTNEIAKKEYFRAEDRLNNRFQRFIDSNYGSLFSLSGNRKPTVVTRVLEHLNARPSKRKALIVIDGMNYWQWTILNSVLKVQSTAASASLAFIPTITAWSRQAIFRGDKPVQDGKAFNEAKLFSTYWINKGFPEHQVDFVRFGVDSHFDVNSLHDDVRIIGLLCKDLDDIMHGAILGDEQLRVSTEQWIRKSEIVSLVSKLQTSGFEIFITSDHGNIQASGVRNLTTKEKFGALSRSKRFVHFDNDVLANDFMATNNDFNFGRRGLSLYLRNREALTLEGKQVITHGGSHLWEVLVPFITIS